MRRLLSFFLFFCLISLTFATQYEQSLPNLCGYYNGTNADCTKNPIIYCAAQWVFPTLTCQAKTNVCVKESTTNFCLICGTCAGGSDTCGTSSCGSTTGCGLGVCTGLGTGAGNCVAKGGFLATCYCNQMCTSNNCNLTSNTCNNMYKSSPNLCKFYNGTSATCSPAANNLCPSGYYYPTQACSATPAQINCIPETAATSCAVCGNCNGFADTCSAVACGTSAGFGCADTCDGQGTGAASCNSLSPEGGHCHCNGMCDQPELTCQSNVCRMPPSNMTWQYPPANNMNVTGNPFCRMNYTFNLTNATADFCDCVVKPLFGGIPPIFTPFDPESNTSCAFNALLGAFNYSCYITDSNSLTNWTNETGIDTMNFTCNQPAINMTWLMPSTGNNSTYGDTYDFQFLAVPTWNNTLYNVTGCGLYLDNSSGFYLIDGTYNETTFICDIIGYTHPTEDVWITGWAENAWAYNETTTWNFSFMFPNINVSWMQPASNNTAYPLQNYTFQWDYSLGDNQIFDACWLTYENGSGSYNLSGVNLTEVIEGSGCYQESTTSTDCGSYGTGISMNSSLVGDIGWNTNFGPDDVLYDGDWGTGAYANCGGGFSSNVQFYSNYTKVPGATNDSIWQVSSDSGGTKYNITNLSSDCWNAYPDKLMLKVDGNTTNECASGYMNFSCYDGSGWRLIDRIITGWLTEEGMWWVLAGGITTYCEANFSSPIQSVYALNITAYVESNDSVQNNTPTWAFNFTKVLYPTGAHWTAPASNNTDAYATYYDFFWAWDSFAEPAFQNCWMEYANATGVYNATGTLQEDGLSCWANVSVPISPSNPMNITAYINNSWGYQNSTENWTINVRSHYPTDCALIEPGANSSSTLNSSQRFRWNCTIGNMSYSSCVFQVQNSSGYYNETASIADSDVVIGYQNESCYQETSTIANDCGALAGGSYSATGSGWSGEHTGNLAYDGDWSTYALATYGFDYYATYVIPDNAVAAKLNVSNADGTVNYTVDIPSNCLVGDTLVLYFNIGNAVGKKIMCGGQTIYDYDYEGGRLYEEGVNWTLSSGIFEKICETNYSRVGSTAYPINITGFMETDIPTLNWTPTWEFTFASQYGNLTVNSTIGGTATGNNSTFVPPANLSISAMASENYSFANWSVTEGNCTINDTESVDTQVEVLNTSLCNVQASFEEFPKANLSLTVTGNGIAITNQTDFYVPATYPINATPDTNWTFTNWTVTQGTCTIGNNTNPNTNATITASENCIIDALFTDNPRANLTVNATAGGNAIGNQSNFYIPAIYPINSTANAGYYFTSWKKISGTCVIGNSSVQNTTATITASENCSVQANFALEESSSQVFLWNGFGYVPFNSTNRMRFRCLPAFGTCQPLFQNAGLLQPILLHRNNGTGISTWQAFSVGATYDDAILRCGISPDPSMNPIPSTAMMNYSTSNLSVGESNSIYCFLTLLSMQGSFPKLTDFNFTMG